VCYSSPFSQPKKESGVSETHPPPLDWYSATTASTQFGCYVTLFMSTHRVAVQTTYHPYFLHSGVSSFLQDYTHHSQGKICSSSVPRFYTHTHTWQS
jgi:hypothetical protein